MEAKKLSRRAFLKASGLTLAAGAVTCAGLGYAASVKPEIETPEMNFGKEGKVENRILITYATRAGSTVEIAAAIGKSLSEKGFSVDVEPVEDNPSLEGYQAVIMGSAIRMGSWLPEAVEYVEINQYVLERMPVALFTVHMLNTGEDDESRNNRLAYLSKVRPLLNDPEEVFFEGRMDFSRLSFLDRMIAKMVDSVEADHRDWERINNWMPDCLLEPVYS